MPSRKPLWLVLLALLAAARLHAGDDIRAVSSLWNDFVQALRRGDYRVAHAMFSPQSRQALPFAEFVREYGPLSAAREMVLAKPDNLAVQVDDDWAEIGYSGRRAGGAAYRVGVAAVKNADSWGLVAARNEKRERVEAEARGVLATAAVWRGSPNAPALLRDFVAASAGQNPLIAAYVFETDGQSFRALPREPGLRTFHLDAWGMVRSGEAGASGALAPMPPPASPAPPPAAAQVPKPSPVLVDGLPELAEPPAAFPAAPPSEPAEPPPPDFSPRRGAGDPEPVRLPDTIR